MEPQEEFEGYTGNAGMTLDRWYRHAAIFLWPERKHFEILCDRDSRKVVPVLEQLVSRWQKAGARDAAALRSQCIDLARRDPHEVAENPYARGPEEKPENADLLGLLVLLEDPGLIGRVLGDVMIKDAAVDPGKSLDDVFKAYGWATFRGELEALFKATKLETLERNVRLLERICLAKPRKKDGWNELCETLANATVESLEAIDARKPSYDWR